MPKQNLKGKKRRRRRKKEGTRNTEQNRENNKVERNERKNGKKEKWTERNQLCKEKVTIEIGRERNEERKRK